VGKEVHKGGIGILCPTFPQGTLEETGGYLPFSPKEGKKYC
jgi:hypothetical protein